MKQQLQSIVFLTNSTRQNTNN